MVLVFMECRDSGTPVLKQLRHGHACGICMGLGAAMVQSIEGSCGLENVPRGLQGAGAPAGQVAAVCVPHPDDGQLRACSALFQASSTHPAGPVGSRTMATTMKTTAPLAVARFGRVNVVRLAASKGFTAARKAQLKTLAAVQVGGLGMCMAGGHRVCAPARPGALPGARVAGLASHAGAPGARAAVRLRHQGVQEGAGEVC